MSIDITIEGVSKFHVCETCGSEEWHLNLVVKADQWYLDPDWQMYCHECESEATIENLVHIDNFVGEFKEKEVA